MSKIVNEDVANYYGKQSDTYITDVRDKSAYRRAISQRELAFVLKHLKPGGKVLEIGCGPGFFTRELVKHAGSVLATDIAPEMVKALKTNIPAENLSAMPIDVYNLDQVPNYGEYDTVVCMRVLCHVDDASVGLAKLRGAIHDKGNIIFDLLNDLSYVHFARVIKGTPLTHTKYYRVNKMREIIKENKLEATDSFGRGYPYIGGWTLDKVGYQMFPDFAHGVGFNVIESS